MSQTLKRCSLTDAVQLLDQMFSKTFYRRSPHPITLSKITATVISATFLLGCAANKQTMRNNNNDQPIRISCVGDSITYGAGIEAREINSYPAVLGRLMGSRFEIRNFGVNGTTYLKKGDYPYWDQPEFEAVARFSPNVVIIKLGTNDSKPQNWRSKAEFADDMRSMIAHFSKLPSRPKIWICTPVPVYKTIGGISEAVVGGEIVPIVRKVAQSEHVQLIDTYAALSDHAGEFPDGVHPNADGAKEIARTVSLSLNQFYDLKPNSHGR